MKNENETGLYSHEDLVAEYARRTKRLAELVAEAEGDLELIGFHHDRFAYWCAWASKKSKTV